MTKHSLDELNTKMIFGENRHLWDDFKNQWEIMRVPGSKLSENVSFQDLNISELYWVSKCSLKYEFVHAKFVCKLDNEMYVYCVMDKSGTCEMCSRYTNDLKAYVSDNLENLILFGLDDTTRNKFQNRGS